MRKENFEKFDKVQQLLRELECEELNAPILVGNQILEMVNDLHGDKNQYGAQVLLPSPDQKYNFVVRICREEYMDEDEKNESVYENLVQKIEAWSEERGLHTADPKIQWMRVTEEVGEIRDVLLKPGKFEDPDHALKDAVGDSLVTINITLTDRAADQLQMLAAYYNVSIQTMATRAIEARLAGEENLDEIKKWWEALRHAESKKPRAT